MINIQRSQGRKAKMFWLINTSLANNNAVNNFFFYKNITEMLFHFRYKLNIKHVQTNILIFLSILNNYNVYLK